MAHRPEQIPQIIDDLRRIFRAINQYPNSAGNEAKLTGPQLWALKILANAAPMRVSELARRLYLTPATVVGILDRLEAKKLVARERCREDRRVVNLGLTELGQELAAKAPEVPQVVLIKGLEALSDQQFAQVLKGMQHMVRILGVEHNTARPMHAE